MSTTIFTTVFGFLIRSPANPFSKLVCFLGELCPFRHGGRSAAGSQYHPLIPEIQIAAQRHVMALDIFHGPVIRIPCRGKQYRFQPSCRQCSIKAVKPVDHHFHLRGQAKIVKWRHKDCQIRFQHILTHKGHIIFLGTWPGHAAGFAALTGMQVCMGRIYPMVKI